MGVHSQGEAVERSPLGGLPPAAPAKAQGTVLSPAGAAPPALLQHRRLAVAALESLIWAGIAALMLFPIQAISLPCVFGARTRAVQGHFVFLPPLKAQRVWKFPLASLMATSSRRTSPAAEVCFRAPGCPMCHFTDHIEVINVLQQHNVFRIFSYLSVPSPSVG